LESDYSRDKWTAVRIGETTMATAYMAKFDSELTLTDEEKALATALEILFPDDVFAEYDPEKVTIARKLAVRRLARRQA
jgi:hypothetical protein